MAAAAFKGSLTIQNAAGETQIESGAFSDVTAAYATWDNWGAANHFKVKIAGPAYIKDICFITGGTDCTRCILEVDNRDAGIKIINQAVITSVDNRVPIPIGPIRTGSEIRLKQLT